MEENTPYQFTPAISIQWRILAAICVFMPSLVLFALFGIVEQMRPVYQEIFGGKPLPGLTSVLLDYGLWMKLGAGLVLFGIAVWILRSDKILPFYYGALSLIVSNLFSLVLLVGIFAPLFALLPMTP